MIDARNKWFWRTGWWRFKLYLSWQLSTPAIGFQVGYLYGYLFLNLSLLFLDVEIEFGVRK